MNLRMPRMPRARELTTLGPLVWPPFTAQPHPDSVPPVAAREDRPLLELTGVSKSYGAGPRQNLVLRDINLSIRQGEFLAIVGYSGSGKTTLLSMMAGLVAPDAGQVLKQGKAITDAGPDRGVVFQNYSLLPWLSVTDNIALAVNQVFRRETAAARRERVEHYIELVKLTPARNQRPAELSGGMRQRVAVARALAINPDILLLDEPLSALDALTRANLQDEITRIWLDERKTVVLVTNDVDEGLMLADRIIPMTIGPGATLGPAFAVDLPRPRDRMAVNHDPAYQVLRREITAWLIDAGTHRHANSRPTPDLPKVRPSTARERAPIGTVHGQAPAQDASRYVEFARVSKTYPGRDGPVTVVDRFDLNMHKGEFISLIGHSGCGKSTMLSMLAGLTGPSSGGIVLDHREVGAPGPDRGIVFQSPSLVPWLTAFDNVMLGVRSVFAHATEQERRQICEHNLVRVGLADAMHRRATELSNGMKQRVGIARAFALQPKVLLLDEPFGMLDSLTRWELQEVLMEVWSSQRLTTLCVTHDIDEAILLADRVVMMTNGPKARVGRILRVDLPRPRTRRALLDHPDYYALRESLLDFLNDHDHGQLQGKPCVEN